MSRFTEWTQIGDDGKEGGSGEHRLWAAICLQAIKDAQYFKHNRREVMQIAREVSTKYFRDMCHLANIDYGLVLNAVRNPEKTKAVWKARF